MALTLQVDLTKELGAAADVLAAQLELLGRKLNAQIGAEVSDLFVGNFKRLEDQPNRNHWPKQHFWADAAKSVNFRADGDGATITVSHQGVRQRLEGGEIKPQNGKKYLTIPARAEAYGKRAGEFNNLKVQFSRKGGRVHAVALVEADSQNVHFGRTRKDGTRKVNAGVVKGGLVMFWLVPSVVQRPDAGVIPSAAEITKVVKGVIAAAVERERNRPK